MGKKALLLRACFLSLFMTCVGAMEEPSLPQEEWKQLKVFNSEKEMVEFAYKVLELTAAENYEEVRSLIPEKWGINLSGPLSLSDVSLYIFSINYGLARYHEYQAAKNAVNLDTCRKEYLVAASYLEDYLQRFGKKVSTIEEVKKRMGNQRTTACFTAAHIYYAVVGTYNNNNVPYNEQDKKILFDYCHKCRDFYNLTLSCLAQPNNLPDKGGIESQAQWELFGLYGCMLTYAPIGDKEKYFTLAKDIHHNFKSNHKGSHQANEMERKLNLFRKLIEKDKRKVSSRTKLKKIREKRLEKLAILDKDIAQTIIEMEEEPVPVSGQSLPTLEINRLFQKMLTFNNISNQEALSEGLKEIEQRMRDFLIDAKVEPSLRNIYEYLEIYLGSTAFHKEFKGIMVKVLLQGNEIRQASERICLIAEQEQKKCGNISLITKFYRAGLRNFLGDNEEWLALEEDMKRVREAKNRRKKEYRQRQIKNIIEQQQCAQQTAEKNHQSPEKERQSSKGKEKEQVAITDADVFINPFPAEYPNEKDLKIKRHEEAEKRRAEAYQEETKEIPVSDTFAAPQEEGPESLPAIGDVYRLTTKARIVDDEIENGTWQFTREDLMRYFRCLGCDAKEGGKHKKVAIPRAIIVTNKDKVLTVLNEFGGALTLPRWDPSSNNGTVPCYLRRQILEARKQLVRMITHEKNN